jgi:hypothetical protein
MKKLCIFFGLVSSLHGAEHNLTLRTRASDALSSLQTRWPVGMPLTLAGCGLLAVAYVGYKKLTQQSCNKVVQPAHLLGTPIITSNNNTLTYHYTCILSEADVKKVDPISFFQSTQFLEHNTHDALLNVNFKTEDIHSGFAVCLSCLKKDNAISRTEIYDYRSYLYEGYEDKYKKPGAQSSHRIFTLEEIKSLNEECIKQRQKQDAWYNRLGWLYRLFKK